MSQTALRAGIVFEKPWTLKTNTGQSITVREISLDYDVNNNPIFFYKTDTGKEGFIDPSNFANPEELTALMEGKPVPKPETKTRNEQKYSGENRHKRESEIRINNKWHKNSTTYLIVSYKNNTDETFKNAVTIKCNTLNKDGDIINTNSRSFFAFEHGEMKPGFNNSLKLHINDIEGGKIFDVRCSVNEW